MTARSVTATPPWTSLPRAKVSFDGELWNFSDSMMSRSLMISRLSLGISTPSEDLPGMRWMRTDSVSRARARSSVRLATWATLIPGAGKYS